jgi:hypothetical protein
MAWRGMFDDIPIGPKEPGGGAIGAAAPKPGVVVGGRMGLNDEPGRVCASLHSSSTKPDRRGRTPTPGY